MKNKYKFDYDEIGGIEPPDWWSIVNAVFTVVLLILVSVGFLTIVNWIV